MTSKNSKPLLGVIGNWIGSGFHYEEQGHWVR
jgi:hypothetical protein